MPIFTDVEIERLFGADDAENESKSRFLEYFYSNRAYDSLLADLRIRILVGHKGVGKSALLKRAYIGSSSRQHNIWMQSNDLVRIKTLAGAEHDINLQIEAWKDGILRYIAIAILEKMYGDGATKVAPEVLTATSPVLKKIIAEALKQSSYNDDYGIIVYIDDIDRGWAATRDDIKQISALLNCIRDIAGPDSSPRLTFRIGLRSDVYFLVRTSDESTDKIERNVIWLKWNNDDILRLMAIRIQTYFKLPITNIHALSQAQITKTVLSKVIEPVFAGAGKWQEKPIHNVLLSMTRARPRDLVKLLRGAAKKAYASQGTVITTKNLKDYFESYSQDRLQDIVNEFRSELPEVQRLLFAMKPTKKENTTATGYQFTTDALSAKISTIQRSLPLAFTSGRRVTPRSLMQFLYKVDFITARIMSEDGEIERKYFDESRFLADEIVEFGYAWEIHPAYRWALQPQDVQQVLDSILKQI